jgi:membrane-bound inhibitor of C-type lysozyme
MKARRTAPALEENAMRFHPTLLAAALVLAIQIAGCEHKPTKEEEEAAKATFACQRAGELLIMRFEPGEVRLLTSTAERITLYQIPTASGIRYSNASLELRGKGMDLVLIDNGVPTKLEGCAPYAPPKPAS